MDEMKPGLSLVIPFYNEEACAGPVVRGTLEALEKAGLDFELILVENASSDGTRRILEGFSGDPRVKVLKLERNIGYGGAVTEGLAAAAGRHLGFTCGDGEIEPGDTAKVCRIAICSGEPVCKARRVDRLDGPWRKFLSVAYHLLVGLLFRVHVTDVNGYPVILTREAYEAIGLTSRNWVFNVELLVKARRLGFGILEPEILHRRRAGGRSHVGFGTPLAFLAQLLRLRLSDFGAGK
ncbi:MAG: glycosyltransferase family 2 protein [Elusimicrobiales bacterium]|jgi:glycosyltransferase involved in cell wall biosynthesis|nr:glycosyltransferase family 2 protein [Elusimicrobiales bacterium]